MLKKSKVLLGVLGFFMLTTVYGGNIWVQKSENFIKPSPYIKYDMIYEEEGYFDCKPDEPKSLTSSEQNKDLTTKKVKSHFRWSWAPIPPIEESFKIKSKKISIDFTTSVSHVFVLASLYTKSAANASVCVNQKSPPHIALLDRCSRLRRTQYLESTERQCRYECAFHCCF